MESERHVQVSNHCVPGCSSVLDQDRLSLQGQEVAVEMKKPPSVRDRFKALTSKQEDEI